VKSSVDLVAFRKPVALGKARVVNVRGNTQNSKHKSRMYKNTNADGLR